MATETFDDLEWDIDDSLPLGYSTPDDLEEYWYRATAVCPGCGNKIEGTAYMWTNGDSIWLHNVDYEPCNECEDNDEYDEDYELEDPLP